jgi:glycosyltransferase involved in cell wall biosynthesis
VLTYYRTSSTGLSSGLQRMENGWLRLVEEARCYAPILIERHYRRAYAIQLRYLARRALRLRCPPAVGLDYMARSLRSDWTLLLRQPRRTVLTATALVGQAILRPSPMPSSTPLRLPPLPRNPLVSVVIPLYNAAATVAKSLESVLAQSYRQLEIIIVDDGSTDSGVDICGSYNDPRIRVVHQRNRGLAGARNTGIRHAHGEILGFLDSDDLWSPNKVELHVRHFQANPSVGVSFSRSELIDRNGDSLGIFQTPKLRDITAADVLCRNPISNGSCVLIRREVLDGIQFEDNLYGSLEDFWFDDSFRQSEDIECWLRIAVQTPYLIEGIPEPLTLYRVNSGGLSADVEKQYASWCRVIEKAGTYAPDLIARQGRRAKAYQLRYLARRAIRERQPRLGVRLLHRALHTHPGILAEEPARTVISLVAGYVALLLPPVWYGKLETAMMALVGRLQRLRLPAASLRPRRR